LPFYSASNLVKKVEKKAQFAYHIPFMRFGWNRFGTEENIIPFQDCGATRNNAPTLSMIVIAWEREIGVHAARKRTDHSFQWKTTSRPEITSICGSTSFIISILLPLTILFILYLYGCISLTFFLWLSVCRSSPALKSPSHISCWHSKDKTRNGIVFQYKFASEIWDFHCGDYEEYSPL
jgi:hypothetical protein